jgi:predicted ATP-dependent endonuclease of OLD family
MLLEKLLIENYKGFGSQQTIEFASPGSPGQGLTVIVGPNNAGKSTILRALRHLTSTDDVFIAGADDRRSNVVKLRLEGKTDDKFEISVEGRGQAARLAKKRTIPTQAIDDAVIYIPSRRPWTDRFHTQGSIGKKSHELGVYQNLKSQEFYVDNAFGSAIANIEINDAAKKSYSELLSKLEPTIVNWTIDNREMDFISFTSVSGSAHRAGLVGEGVANIFRLAYALYDFKKGDVLLLDEPELSLHPQAQKRLYAELRSRAEVGQIVISTHSPHFVSWADIQNGAKIYRANLVPGDGTSLSTLSDETIKSIAGVTSDKKNRKLYDVVAKEVFFSTGCLFVEGQEDAHIVGGYIEEKNLTPIEIFGYGAGGASLIKAWLSVANDLNVRAAAIFDGDSEGIKAFASCAEAFGGNANILLKKLSTSDIRDKPKEGKEGLFDENWILKWRHMREWQRLLKEITNFLNRAS